LKRRTSASSASAVRARSATDAAISCVDPDVSWIEVYGKPVPRDTAK